MDLIFHRNMSTYSRNIQIEVRKLGLEQIEKLSNPPNWSQNLILETWYWKSVKNISSMERILLSKKLDFQAKSQSQVRRTLR